MAIGFTPKYSQSVTLNGLSKPEFLALAFETASVLGWTVGFISESGLIACTNNGRYLTNSEITVRLAYGGVELKSESTGNEMFDMGKNRKNLLAFLDKFHQLKPTFTTEELLEKHGQLKASFAPNTEDILLLPPERRDVFDDFLSVFWPSKGYTITPIMANINLLVFIVMACCGVNIIDPQHGALIAFGGNLRVLVLDGDWWRLLTACFLHIGIVHLVLNMAALVFVGMMLEPFLGKARFLAAYLLTGIAASSVSLLWHSQMLSAGASGAIFGMYGVFFALLTTNILDKSIRQPMLISIGVFIISNLISGMEGNTDNAAHVGGLISGIIIGYALVPSLRKPDEKKLKAATLAISSAFTLLCCIGIGYAVSVSSETETAVGILNDVVPENEEAYTIYRAKMQEFHDIEKLALEVYGRSKYEPAQEILHELRDRSDYYWNEGIRITKEVDELDLSEAIKSKNHTLREYCELRLKTNDLLYKTVDEKTEAYRPQLQDCAEEIEAKMHELGED